MPQKDFYHDVVVNALLQDGWKVTHDPLTIPYGGRNLFVDLGAERPIAAEKEGRKIAVEVKSFLSASSVHDLAEALGKYDLYQEILREVEPDRSLYVAISKFVYDGIFSEPIGQLLINRRKFQLIVFDEKRERIVRWIP